MMGKKRMRCHDIRLLLLLFISVVNGALIFSRPALAADPAIRIVSPPDAVWVTEKNLFLAGTVQGIKIDNIELKGVDTKLKNDRATVNEGGVFGAPVSLKNGLNTIKIGSDKLQTSVRVFYTPDQKKNAPPKDFKRFYVHQKPSTLNCQDCHRLKKGEYDFKKIIPARADCTTGECHTDKGKAKHVHGPVGAGVCISCHSPHGTFEAKALQRTGGDLCLVCHQAKKEEFNQEVIHAPVEEGCTDCHDPHQSNMRFQLKAEGEAISALCFNCHEDGIFTKKHQHGPVGSGMCIACHQPHSSANASLLIAPTKDGQLCFECHEDRKAEFTMENIHAPVQEDCNKCHDPHSSDAPYQLHEEGGKLCASCHEEATPEIYTAINTAKVKHPPVDEGKCVACHRPHSSNYGSLLKDSMEKLCLSCHTDLGDIIADSQNRHGPVQTGDCAACHNVHGSQFSKLLARYFPMEFYSPYEPENYDLCFGCHNKDIAKTKLTTTLTNFRDGNYNLHYFHVNMKKGRTCTSCHDAHASNQGKHVRYEVPFGAWSYPISFTKSKVGGTCVVGCHAPKTYDRNNPQIKHSR
ncbi:MAG: hypothetical protein KKB30_08740 [Proteobacteria bacterium]|nr:hypothetical protein [Pseudomonadota bacterium]MBU1716891.1 hypothetical protein [Pseudomonadota bacterium]